MGLRETINKNPKVGFVLTGGLLAVAVAALAYSFWPEGELRQEKAFYTSDEGKTLFVDSVSRVPPFDHDGKPAVRAAVYSTDGGKTRFVGYLQRYNDATKKKLDAVAGKTGPGVIGMNSPEAQAGIEVKRPSDPTWVSGGDLRARGEVMRVKAPPGQSGIVDSVYP